MTKESTPITLSEAFSRYLATQTNSDRQNAQQELGKFVRWYGPERLMTDIHPVDVGNYAESLGTASVPDPTKRLEPVRAFLNYAKKEGLTGTNLAPHLRARKTTSKSKVPDNRMASTAPVHFTAAGLEKLEAELANLKHQRVKVAEALRHAMADKDFRENAPLDAAREEQGRLEARIRQLEATLKVAAVMEKDENGSAKVGLGTTAILRDLDSQEEVKYTLVNPGEVDLSKGKISVASPTGRAVVEREIGEVVEVAAPMGTLRYRIEEIC